MELNEYLSVSRAKRIKKIRSWRLSMLIGAVAAVTAAIIWLFVWSPVFRVDRIVVHGAVGASIENVTAVANAAFAQSNGIFKTFGIHNILAWPSNIPESAQALEPRLMTATLAKRFGAHEIVVTVTERKPVAIWCVIPGGTPGIIDEGAFDEMCSWFDSGGTLFAQTFDTEGAMLFAVHDYSRTTLTLGTKILPDRFMPNLFSILGVIRASKLRVKEVRLDNLSSEEIRVTTYDGPDIKFSLRFSADATLEVLQDIMRKSGFGKLQYVDFRTQNRAYYE